MTVTQPQIQNQIQNRNLGRNSIETRATSNSSRDQYYNPDPLARLIGKSNESTIIIDGKKCIALIDSGAHKSQPLQ